MIYRLYVAGISTFPNAAMTIGVDPQVSFIFAPANTDYQRFKADIANGGELQDADGVVMSADAAKAFVATLP